jgi:hypothetical protein
VSDEQQESFIEMGVVGPLPVSIGHETVGPHCAGAVKVEVLYAKDPGL